MNKLTTKQQWIKLHGLTARGKKELLAYLDGKRLTARQAVISHCYSCMGYYIDGKVDCKISECPAYGFMPYREVKLPPVRQSSEKQRQAGRNLGQISKIKASHKVEKGAVEKSGQNTGDSSCLT